MDQKRIIQIFSEIKMLNIKGFDVNGKQTHTLSGTVEVEKTYRSEMVFKEKLHWEKGSSLLINSKNVYRWNFPLTGNIKLEHLRFGKNNPVDLVELIPAGENFWQSKIPHICNNDLYSAELTLASENIILCWTVKGPNENYSLKIAYS